MGWKGAWALVLGASFKLGRCIETPCGSRSLPQLARNGLHQHQSPPDVVSRTCIEGTKPAWIGPFELLSEEELRWWKESMFGREETPPPGPPSPEEENGKSSTTNAADEGPAGAGRRLLVLNKDRLAALVEGASQALADASDGGARALRTLAASSVGLGREGGVWLRRRWRKKALYFLVGVYGLRLARRVIATIKMNALSSGDIILDAEDRNLLNRGAILDTEGQAIILRLRALGVPNDAGAAGSASAVAATAIAIPQPRRSWRTITHKKNYKSGGDVGDVGHVAAAGVAEGDGGWQAVESSMRHAIGLRYAGRGGGIVGGRARYSEELADALRKLEQARDEADLETLGPQHASLVEQAVLLAQARLCDASLRTLRDGLMRASSDLSDLSSYWKDQRSNHRRMGLIKSVVLGRLVHGQVSGKRAAVETDQENISTAELLLEGYLRKFGGVQAHLQARPKAHLITPEPSTMAAAGGAVFSQGYVDALEEWVEEGVELFLGSLRRVEAALEQQQASADENVIITGIPTAGGVDSKSPSAEKDTPVVAAAAIFAAGATSVAAAEEGSGMLPRAHDAFDNIVSSGTFFVRKADNGSKPLLQLRAGGDGAGGGVPLPSSGDATKSRGSRGALMGAAAAAYGNRNHRLPAVLLLRSKPKKPKPVEAEGGAAGSAGKHPGKEDESLSLPASSWGTRRAAKKRALEEARKKGLSDQGTSSRKPGSAGGGRQGGAARWRADVAMKRVNGRGEGTVKAGKSKECKTRKVSSGRWKWLRPGEGSTTDKRACGGGGGGSDSAANPSAPLVGPRKEGAGASREGSVDALERKAPEIDSPKVKSKVEGNSNSSRTKNAVGTTNGQSAAGVDGKDGGWRRWPFGGGEATPAKSKQAALSTTADRAPAFSKTGVDEDSPPTAPVTTAGITPTTFNDTETAGVIATATTAPTTNTTLGTRAAGPKQTKARVKGGTIDGQSNSGSLGRAREKPDSRAEEGQGAISSSSTLQRRPASLAGSGTTGPPEPFGANPSGVNSSRAFSSPGDGDDIYVAYSSAASPSTRMSLTPDIYARALQRDEKYARGRRLELIGRKRDAGAISGRKSAVIGDGGGVTISSGDPSSSSDEVDLAAGTVTGSPGVGVLTAFAGRCAAACGTVAAGISRGAVVLATSPSRLMRAVAASFTPSKADDVDDGDEDGTAGAGTALKVTPVGNNTKAGEGDDIDDTLASSDEGEDDDSAMLAASALDHLYQSFSGGVSFGYEGLAATVNTMANGTFAPRDLDDDEKRAMTAAGAQAAAGRQKISRMIMCPFEVMVVGPCAYLYGLVSAGVSACCEVAAGAMCSLGNAALSVRNGALRVAKNTTRCCIAGAGFALSSPARLGRLAGRSLPVGAKGVSACCKAATRAVCSLGDGTLNVGSGALRVAQNTIVCCVAGAGFVLSSTAKLGRLAGKSVPAGAGQLVGGVTAKLKLKHRCILVGRGVSVACVSATASVCLVGSAVVKGVKKYADVAGRTAGVTLSAPVKLSRAFGEGSGRVSRSAGRAGVNLSRAVVTGSGRVGRSAAAVTTAAWFCTAATACMMGEAAAQGAIKSTKTCLGCCELAGRMVFVLPAKTVARVFDVALRHRSDGGGKASKKQKTADEGSAGATTSETPAGRKTKLPASSSAVASAVAGSVWPAGWFKRWTARAMAYPGSLLEGRSSKASLAIPTTLSDLSCSGFSLPSPSRAQEAEAALARWVLSAPAVGVSESSGRRSRLLVDVAMRARRVTAPSSGSRSKSTAAGVAGGGGVRAPCVSRALRALAANEAAEAGAARPAHWRRVRRAARLAILAPVAVRSARCAQSNWAELGRVTTEAAAGVSIFFSDQLWQPCEAISKQVFFRERSNLMDKHSLEDAETSLQNMLRDFVEDTKNDVPEDIREEAVLAMDMSVVSRELEEETKSSIRGTVNGRIPRMLLIQATFLKKELLHLMQAIDELFQANQVTLKLISVIPAALLIFAAVKVSGPIVHVASSRRLEPTALVHRSMRASLREIERLLISSRGFVRSNQVVGDESAGVASRGLLEDEEMGKMALHLHDLQTTLRKNASRFDSRARGSLEEDLADLMARGRPTVSQQIAVIHRMQRSYPFLRAGRGNGRGGGGGGRKVK